MTELRELAVRFGSPLYAYQLDEVAAAYEDLRLALPHPSSLLYSLKANPHPEIVRALLDHGCKAEVSSLAELEAVVSAGGAPEDVLYTGPGKSAAELDAALRAGSRLLSVESPLELARLHRAACHLGVEVDCLLRVNAHRAAAAGGLRMGGTATQFGMDLSWILAEPEAFRGTSRVHVVGVHLYTATNVSSPEDLLRTLEVGIETGRRLRELGAVELRRLDLGGGFAAPYGQPGTRQRYRFAEALERELDDALPGWREGDPSVAFESGRYLVGGCGTLVATVVDVKRSRARLFAILDAGINHLGGLSGLGRLLPLSAEPLPNGNGDRETAVVDLVGPLCTPLDVLGRGVGLPAPVSGDLVAIPNAGAYGLTASLLAFLGRPAPVEVVLRGDRVLSASRLSVRRCAVAEAQR